MRRVREDFGVEIEIDLSRIRPGPDNLSKEHIAVGVIHYDGVGGTDKGTILYFRPTLTGDEPPDVQQYHARKPRFPHESTGDQFFDEAQWESYRRLGEHTTNASLRTLEEEEIPPNGLFYKIRSDLEHVPWLDNEAGVRLYEHAAGLESALDAYPSPTLRHEFVGAIVGIEGLFVPGADAGNSQVDADQTTRDVLLAIRALKLMEEAWYVCDLDNYWSHPRATSWVACLQRWAAMPTLSKWWPVLKALFGDGFQHFADEHLHLPTPVSDGDRSNHSGDRVELKLTEHYTHLPRGFALQRSRLCHPPFEKRGRDCLASI